MQYQNISSKHFINVKKCLKKLPEQTNWVVMVDRLLALIGPGLFNEPLNELFCRHRGSGSFRLIT